MPDLGRLPLLPFPCCRGAIAAILELATMQLPHHPPQQPLLSIQEQVFKIPPRVGASGWRSGEWRVNDKARISLYS